MRILSRIPKRKTLVVLAAVAFAAMGTFYWSLWSIPWIGGSDEVTHEGSQDWGPENSDMPTGNIPEQPICLGIANDDMITSAASRYCSWDTTLQSCHQKLLPAIGKRRSWVFLGGSEMAKLAHYVSLKTPFAAGNVTTHRNSCQNLAYYGLPPPDHAWVPPDETRGEGPSGYGRQNPFCMDCRKCWNLLKSNHGTTNEYIEYLVVEYARDVSLPTLVTNTTQETAAYYLGRRHSPPVCVASAGILDAMLEPAVPVDLFVQNVDKYMSMLQRICHHVIWIGIHAVVEAPGLEPKNCRLLEWNNAIKQLMARRNYQNVYLIDIWEKSLKTHHDNLLGLEMKFYASLARLFVTFMTDRTSTSIKS